ncbi:DUF58 domain-containing protein [Halovenus rubra]|uniref:DUF58 domain-containing protein n=2 Tax=Halovenus rubra TaxID=869890 RepID=A0ACC7E4X1_9EURY|nr:DUF58 domain-containing protein [Halovenus rubra]
MKLTRRGRVAVMMVLLAVGMGLVSGARALNAIAAPTLTALVVSAVLVYRREPPTASLSSVEPGFPGEERSLSVALTGTGLSTVSLSLPERVNGDTAEQEVTLPQSVSYNLELGGRGVHQIGPPTLSLRGPLGLLERDVSVEGTTEVTVFPQRYSVENESMLARLFADELEAERQEFDRLREYRPGDPLRHIHWKSSAKHDTFLVTEFDPATRDETVSIVGTAPQAEVDRMARLAATIADLAFDAGYKIELATPSGHVPPGAGDAHRENILQLLAKTKRGNLTALGNEEVDVEITYAKRELIARLGAQEFTIPQLLERIGAHVDGESTTPESEVAQ